MNPVPFALAGVFTYLYALGGRRASLRSVSATRRRSWERLLRSGSFYAGVAAVVIALEPPVDQLSQRFFFVHMAQHLLLMMVGAPLIVLGAPWSRSWRPLPIGFRRPVARTVALSRALRPVRAAAHWIASPVPAFVLFTTDLAVWHVPQAYDLTLSSPAVHYAEHVSFLLLGIVFWAQIIDSPPLRSRLDYPGRVAFAVLGGVASWILAVLLALAPHPLYAYPGHGQVSALTDQQLAGGMMWGPGSIPLAVYVFYGLYRWLGEEEPGSRRRRRPGRRRLEHAWPSRP
jgi:cytochrome c oxidase assembly factor CtaG